MCAPSNDAEVAGPAEPTPEPARAVDAQARVAELHAIVQHAPVILAMFDRDMTCLAASLRWTRVFNRGQPSPVGLNHYELHPDLPERWREAHRRALAGEAVACDDDLLVHADGTRQWVRWAVAPWLDARGEVGGITIVTEDITAWKLAEEAAAESRAHFEAIVESATDAILSVDAALRVRSFNAAAERVFGVAAAEAIGGPLDRFIPARHHAAHAGHMRRFAAEGAARRLMGGAAGSVGLRADGVEFPLEASIAQTEVRGEPIFTVILRDITERRQIEREVLAVSAREQRRIGLALHDDLCQSLAGTHLLTVALARDLALESPATAGRARKIADHLQLTLDRARTMARGLAPAVIDSDGLGGALRELAAGALELHRVPCRYVGPDHVRARDPMAALHLYRIAQEAVRAAALHEGAREVELLVEPRGEHVAMTIRGDGRGPSPPEAFLDLRTMRYRAGVVGATLEVCPGADGGTEVVCVFPHGG